MMWPAKRFTTMAIGLGTLALLSRVLPHGNTAHSLLHDVEFVSVLSPDRIFLVMAAFSLLFAAAYSAFPMNTRASNWHFWMTLGGIAGFWISYYLWTYLLALRISSHSIAPALERSITLAFMLSFLVLMFSPAIFAVNFTFAMGRMRMSHTKQ